MYTPPPVKSLFDYIYLLGFCNHVIVVIIVVISHNLLLCNCFYIYYTKQKDQKSEISLGPSVFI